MACERPMGVPVTANAGATGRTCRTARFPLLPGGPEYVCARILRDTIQMRYDVIIVGAGPAGSTAARETALLGLSVLSCSTKPGFRAISRAEGP